MSKDQYQGALDSIFNFIFTESKKPANKVKPVKVTGVDGSNEFMDAVAAVLENPLLFVNDTTKNAFEGLINPDIATVDLGPNEKVKLSLKDVGSVLKGDTSFIDKQLKKLEANRKKGTLEWAGEELSNIVATAWAKEHGLDITTRDALMNMSKSADAGGLRDLNTSALSKALAEELLARGVNFNNMQESAFKAAFGEKEGGLIYSSLQKVVKEYKEAQTTGRSTKEILDSIDNNHYTILYPVFQSKYMEEKAEEEEEKGDEEKAKYYQQAQRAIDIYTQGSLRDRYLQRMQFKLQQEEREIRDLLASGKPVSRERINNMRREASRMRAEIRILKGHDLARRFGKWEGHYKSVKGLYEQTTGGQLLPAILTGDFFDSRKNTVWGLQPTQEMDFKYGNFLVDDKDGFIKIKIAKTYDEVEVDESGKVIEGKGVRGPLGRKVKTLRVSSRSLSKAYNQMMTDIYYLTPAVLVRTLGTGERFAYKAHRQVENFLDKYKHLFPNLDLEKLFGPDGENYLVTFSNLEDFAKLEEFFRKNKRLRTLAYNFGVLDRTKRKITKFLQERINPWFGALRGSLGNWLLKRIQGPGAKNLIEQWMKKGAFKVLIEGIKMSIKTALGITTSTWGLIVSFVIDRFADIARSIGEKALSPILKIIFTVIIFTLVGIIGLGTLSLTSLYMNTRNMYSHVAPKDVIVGDADLDIASLYPQWDEEWEDRPPLPPGINCPFGLETVNCVQGPYVGTHIHGLLAIDIMSPSRRIHFYAPGYCSEPGGECYYYPGEYTDCYGGGSGGGQVVLETSYKGQVYNFRFVHVRPNENLRYGQKVKGGQHLGYTMRDASDGNYSNVTCFGSGEHIHLEIYDEGGRIHPYYVLTKGKEVGGLGCSVTPCPGGPDAPPHHPPSNPTPM